jgi:alpha/beta superfamily hydrolase
MTTRPVTLRAEDGVELEAELALPGGPGGVAVVLCHPHPQFGGSMRSLVTSLLFTNLAAAGYPCLRFNFRGVERSAGEYTDGEREPLDVVAAVAAMNEAEPSMPIAVVGWSFGGDMALAVGDPRLAGWVAIAPPLRFARAFAAATDERPKHLILAEHDDFRAPADVQAEVAGWTATTVSIVPGASHFFVGRTDAVVTETRAALDRLTGG